MNVETASARTLIRAQPAVAFAVLAHPTQHCSIDGTGWVCEAVDAEPITHSGQVFRMGMFHLKHPDGTDEISNQVLDFVSTTTTPAVTTACASALASGRMTAPRAMMGSEEEVVVLLDQCRLPVVLAPLAGRPSTPELCAAVSNAGGLGFLAAGYLSASELATRIERTRALTSRPFGVNLFFPGPIGEASRVEAYAQRLTKEAGKAGVRLGELRWDDDDWAAKLDLLAYSPVALASVTFGCPSHEDIDRLKRSTGEVWVTVTTVDEARQAQEAGVDCLVVQGAEAGGHRGGFTDEHEGLGLLALVQLVRASMSAPLIATGGIMTGAGLAGVLAAGARAGALGTAFLRCPEAGTSSVHRAALARHDRPTALTRAFTGRLARGMSNRFLQEHTDAAPTAYPQVHHLTAPLRAHGRTAGDLDLVNLWAGQAYALTHDLPAGQIVHRVAHEARTALKHAGQLLG